MESKENNVEYQLAIDLQATADYFEYLAIDENKDGEVLLTSNEELTKFVGNLAMAMYAFENLRAKRFNERSAEINKTDYSLSLKGITEGRINAESLVTEYITLPPGKSLSFKLKNIPKYIKALNIAIEAKDLIGNSIGR